MPQKKGMVKRKMTQAHGEGNQPRKEGEISLRLKKLRMKRKELRMQYFLDAWQINLGVFRIRMIAMDRKRTQRKQQQASYGFKGRQVILFRKLKLEVRVYFVNSERYLRYLLSG